MLGHTLWDMDEQTLGKHFVLKEYLNGWFPILGRWNSRIVFIDGFAGPGQYRGGEPGSPMIALDAIDQHSNSANLQGTEVVCIFIEESKDRADFLRSLLGKRGSSETVKTSVLDGTFSDHMTEMLDYIDEHDNTRTEADFSQLDMALREPKEPLFRIAQMGLAYEANDNKIILVAQEFVPQAEEDFEDDDAVDELDERAQDEAAAYHPFEGGDGEPQTVRMWCTREQMRALSLHALDTVKSGRPDAKQNGRIIFYWS